MIYFDNSATTIKKPAQVAQAVAYAVDNFGNVGRSFYDPVMLASREVLRTRAEIAKLIGCGDPLNIAFTASATESLNLVIGGLIGKNDSVITTVAEHNSVLRPLYLTGCELSFIGCDDNGVLLTESADELITPDKRALVCTHGSNVTGNITDVAALYRLCKRRGVIMVLDISQTFGAVPVTPDMADIFCFTGHKALYGPQGTGGVIVTDKQDFRVVKTGGAGVNSFERSQSGEMPDIFEAGTLNSHCIYGLQQGVRFINETGIDEIHAKETRLVRIFYNAVKQMGRVKIYGDFSAGDRLSIVSLNVDGLTSGELAERLWTSYGIATRAGSHCAPLLHERLGTAQTGMVRLSFSYFNTKDEIEAGVRALSEIVNELG